MAKSLFLYIFIILIPVCALSQKVKYIGGYFLREDLEEDLNYFKIGKYLCSFDVSRNFYLNDKLLFSYPADSTVTYEVMERRFLIVSFYPIAEVAVSTGPSVRMKDRIQIYDLKHPNLKWQYFLHYHFNSTDFKKFKAYKGKLVLGSVRYSQALSNN